MNQYHGKRFAGLLICVVILLIGYVWGPPESFGAFAGALGTIYGAYAIGQSATDWKESNED